MPFEDKTLLCWECGSAFRFTVSEQAFYAERGLLNEPRRCLPCRAVRRHQRTGRQHRVQHHIICARCGAEDAVPFVPKDNRPVYCGDCYAKIQSGEIGR